MWRSMCKCCVCHRAGFSLFFAMLFLANNKDNEAKKCINSKGYNTIHNTDYPNWRKKGSKRLRKEHDNRKREKKTVATHTPVCSAGAKTFSCTSALRGPCFFFRSSVTKNVCVWVCVCQQLAFVFRVFFLLRGQKVKALDEKKRARKKTEKMEKREQWEHHTEKTRKDQWQIHGVSVAPELPCKYYPRRNDAKKHCYSSKWTGECLLDSILKTNTSPRDCQLLSNENHGNTHRSTALAETTEAKEANGNFIEMLHHQLSWDAPF